MEISKDNMSESMYHLIIFTYLKEFVNELAEHFEDEALFSYRNFINTANPLEDSISYVKSFKNALNGTHKARLCSGVYVDIPKFLENKQFEKPIRGCLDTLKLYYSGDLTQCKEYEFFLKSLKGFATTITDQNENLADTLKSASSKEGDKTQFNELVKKTMESILGDGSYKFGEEESDSEEEEEETTTNIIKKNRPQKLNSERMAKILALTMYEKVDLISFSDNDKNEIKKLAKLVLQNSIRELISKHKEVLFKTVFSLDFLKKIDIMSVFNSMQN